MKLQLSMFAIYLEQSQRGNMAAQRTVSILTLVSRTGYS